jgi:O-antigen/teichoic acid export membrane protein
VAEPAVREPAIARRRRLGPRLAAALGVHDAGRVLRDFATYLPSQAIPAIAGFLVLPLVARRLAPTELGVLAIAQTLITLGWTASGSWLALSIIREYQASADRDEQGSFATTLRMALLVSVGMFGGFLVVLGIAGIFSSAVSDNLFLIAPAALGLVIQNVAVSLFAASLRPRAYAMVEIAARTGGIALGVVLVFAGHKVHGYLLGLATASLVVGVVGLAAAWPRGRNGGRAAPRLHLGAWLRYGVPASLAGLTLWGLFFVDRYLLAGLKSTGAVGVYTVGNVIGDKAVSIPTLAFFTAAGPLLVTAFEQQGRSEVERLMRAYTRIILLVSVPVIAVLVDVADELVPLLAGNRYYASAADVVPIVALGSLLYALGLVATTGLIVAKRTAPLIWAALVGLGVNVVANLVLIPPFGIVGAAIATPIATGAYLAAVYAWSRSHVTWRFPFVTAIRACCAGLLGLGAAMLVPEPASRPLRLVVAAGVVTATYALVLGLLGERRPTASA